MEFAGNIFWDNVNVARLWPSFFKHTQKQILIIEDDREMGAVVKKSLRSRVSHAKLFEEHDYDFEFKHEPEEAVRYFLEMEEDKGVDLIIIDWNLRSLAARTVLECLDTQLEVNLTAERMFKKTPVIVLCPPNFLQADLDLKYLYLYKVIPRDSCPDSIVDNLSATVQSALSH